MTRIENDSPVAFVTSAFQFPSLMSFVSFASFSYFLIVGGTMPLRRMYVNGGKFAESPVTRDNNEARQPLEKTRT
jgi:hypothetical protein